MEGIKTNLFKIVIVIIFSFSLLISAIIISTTGFTIRNLGQSDSNGTVLNSISVSGDGKVSVKPDMVVINFSFSETAATSGEALQKVNEKINSALDILKTAGIEEKDITTTQLSLYTEYDWSSSTRTVIGQVATSGIEAKVKNIDAESEKVTTIIDSLAGINKIQFNGISFDIEDKTAYFTEARDLAFTKARQKAVELSSLSGVKLLTPISITDSTYDTISSPSPLLNYAMEKASGVADSSTTISSGELTVSASLSIIWGIE